MKKSKIGSKPSGKERKAFAELSEDRKDEIRAKHEKIHAGPGREESGDKSLVGRSVSSFIVCSSVFWCFCFVGCVIDLDSMD